MSVEAKTSKIYALIIAILSASQAFCAVDIQKQFSCKTVTDLKNFKVSTHKISVINQKKIIFDEFVCENFLCPKLEISAKIKNKDDQIYNAVLYHPTLGCQKKTGKKFKASNKATRYIVELNKKFRITDLKSVIFSFGNAAICTLDIPKSASNAILKTDPEDYELLCSNQHPKMLVLFDFAETNCRDAYEGKVRVLNNKNLEIRNFKAKDIYGYKSISFRARQSSKGLILKILEFFKLRSDFKTKIPTSDLIEQTFDEKNFEKPKTIRLVLPVGFSSTSLTGFEIHDDKNNVICSVNIEDPVTAKEIALVEIGDDSRQPFAIEY